MNQNTSSTGFDSILASLIEADEQTNGQGVDVAEWTTRYPEYADQIRSYFSHRGKLEAVLGPRGAVDAQAETLGLQTGSAEPGQRIRYFGDYELMEEIARGGMGVVFKARQTSLQRMVALKMILAGNLASASDVQRFRAEAEAAANLDHPHIVPIYEVGEFETQQYFTMKLVDGVSLSQAREQNNAMPLRERERWVALLMAKVARAVHHAHQRGILHRDLKPGNILLDAQGEPHVTDFGLAKKVEGGSDLTNTGAIVGTPAYMAPEQARCEKGLSTAVDVYSLGAILYELLTGNPPFRGKTPLETILDVLNKEPIKPNAVEPEIDRDLETITLKCMEKAPTARYRSAEEVAEELERWLAGEPIHARPVSTLERAQKWIRRNPMIASLIAASVILAMGVVAALAGLLYNAQLRSEETARNLVAAQQAAEREGELTRQAQAERDKAEKAAAIEKRLRTQTEGILYANRISLAHQYWLSNNLNSTLTLLNELPPDRRNWEWNYLHRISHEESVLLPGNGQFTRFLDANRQGNHLLTVADTGLAGVVLWDLEKKQRLWEISSSDNRNVTRAALNPAGTLMGLAERNGEVTLWDVQTRKLLSTLGKLPGQISLVSFYQNDRLLVSTAQRQSKVWDTSSGQEIPLSAKLKNVIAILPDGKRVLCSKRNPRMYMTSLHENIFVLCDLQSGEVLQEFPFMRAYSFTPDSKWMALAGFDSSAKPQVIIQLIDLETGKVVMTTPGMPGSVGDVALSPDGSEIAFIEYMGNPISVYEARTGKVLRTLRGHTSYINSLIYLQSGKLASCSWDNTVRIWQTKQLMTQSWQPALTNRVVSSAAFHPSGTQVAVVQGDNVGASLLGQLLAGPGPGVVVSLLDPLTGKETKLQGHQNGSRLVSYAAEAPRLLSGGRDGLAICWDLTTGKKLSSIKHPGWVKAIALSPDGKWAASTFEPEEATQASFGQGPYKVWPGKVTVWDTQNGQIKRTFQRDKGLYFQLAFHPNKQQIFLATSQGLECWNMETGNKIHELPIPFVGQILFTPDQQHMILAESASIRICHLDTASVMGQIRLPTERSSSMALHPSGNRLVVAAGNQVKLYDLTSQQELITLTLPRQHEDVRRISRLGFTRDGQTLIGLCDDSSTILWHSQFETQVIQ